MTATHVLVNVCAHGDFFFTQLDDEKMPTHLDWEDFLSLVNDGTFKPTVTVNVIEEGK